VNARVLEPECRRRYGVMTRSGNMSPSSRFKHLIGCPFTGPLVSPSAGVEVRGTSRLSQNHDTITKNQRDMKLGTTIINTTHVKSLISSYKIICHVEDHSKLPQQQLIDLSCVFCLNQHTQSGGISPKDIRHDPLKTASRCRYPSRAVLCLAQQDPVAI
jgi:hypothetical protein